MPALPAVPPVPAQRADLVEIILQAVGRDPQFALTPNGPDIVEQIAQRALDALDARGALAERLYPPCPGVHQDRGEQLVCDGIAGHRPRLHWRVDRRTGVFRSWMTDVERAELDIRIDEAVR